MSRTDVDPWSAVSPWHIIPRAFPFAGHFTRHLILRSYRQGIPDVADGTLGVRTRRRLRAAIYDAVMNLMIDGMCELSGMSLRPETGQLVIRLNRLMAAFDDCFEERSADGRSLSFDEVFADRRVQDRLRVLAVFLKDRPEREAIKGFLDGRIHSSYGDYVRLQEASRSSSDPAVQWDIALLDSGGFAIVFLQCVALFHRCHPPEAVVRQFQNVGMVAKLADDLIDFSDDVLAGRVNLLSGLIHRYPDEESRAFAMAYAGERVGVEWWRVHCPQSFGEYTQLVVQVRDAVDSACLRLACDLMLLPCRWRGPVLRSAPVGLRI